MAARTGASLARHTSRCLVMAEHTMQWTFARTMATEATSTMPLTTDAIPVPQVLSANSIHPLQHKPPPNPFITSAQLTVYSFPQLEPTGFATYPSTHLLLPLRKDILHRAVTYEADATRQGTASTKWRGDVHGSGRKVRPQKGTGRARLGDKKSPMLRGGGVAFGPKPRDFSTEFPAKMYDLAWRTALSYRYRRGQLMVIDGPANVRNIHKDSRVRYLADMLNHNNMGHSAGRTLLVTKGERPDMVEAFLEETLRRQAELIDVEDVDVKDLLELGRIMIEREALHDILCDHQSDLWKMQKVARRMQSGETVAKPPTLNITTASPEA